MGQTFLAEKYPFNFYYEDQIREISMSFIKFHLRYYALGKTAQYKGKASASFK